MRKKLHALGFRYRLHDEKLPGRPDIVLPGRQAVVQLRGCFWHTHECMGGRLPKGNSEYWTGKLARTQRRDESNDAELRRMGWRLFVLWECEVKSDHGLSETVEALSRSLAPA